MTDNEKDAMISALRAQLDALKADFETARKIIEDAMPYIPGSSFVAEEIDTARERWGKP